MPSNQINFTTSHPHMIASCGVAVATVTYSLRTFSCFSLFALWVVR